ncbi:hypothetical protein Tco_0666427 [Tanacetum coccineum]
MIKTLSLHDAGILTFSLEGSWIAERINKMLKNGINTWAPTIYDVESRGRVVFVFPTNPFMGSDMVRAIYMRDALENLYLYSGAEVGRGDCDDEAMRRTHDCFTAIRGKIVSNLHPTSLNGSNVEDVFTDLRQINAAANEGWLPCDWRELEATELAECIFIMKGYIVDRKSILGNTFASLLKTQALVLSLIKNSPVRNFKLHALAGKERDLGLHFVKFTEVIERVIGLSLGPRAVEFWALLSRSLRQLTHYHVPSDDARIEHPNSRFEIFSMNVAVANSQFVKGNVCGSVRVIDTCRLADGRGWVSYKMRREDQTYLFGNGSLNYYVVIKDAIDTTMQLTFNPVKAVQLSGSIMASYGKDILGDCGLLGQYTAHIFKADPTTQYTSRKEPHLLPLHKIF